MNVSDGHKCNHDWKGRERTADTSTNRLKSMAAISLWELRKRPIPHGVVLSPSPARPALMPSRHLKPIRSANDRPVSRQLELAFDAADGCQYRGGNACSNKRALKINGSRHTLCPEHRNRAAMNQRRYDAKKRQERAVAMEEKATRRTTKRRNDRATRASKAKTVLEIPKLKPTTHSEGDRPALPSFKDWTAAIIVTHADNQPTDKQPTQHQQ